MVFHEKGGLGVKAGMQHVNNPGYQTHFYSI